jgi:thiosulfate/3-mercaptopyruvate sulfurtransferase
VKKQILILFLIPLLLFQVNCKKEKDDNNASLLGVLFLANTVKVNTAAELANVSDDDYSRNNWGLIEGSKLESWVSDWTANKPAGITGNLIILQTDAANRITGDSKNQFIAQNPAKGVYVYLLDDYQTSGTTTFRFNQTRDTGLVKNSARYQANGAFVDEWLKTFGINPTRDLIVFAVGTGGVTLASGASSTAGTAVGTGFAAAGVAAGPVQDISRGVYWLRYWGVDIKNLAILNGNIRSNFGNSNASLFSNTRSTIPNNNGGFSVRQIRVDNTVLTLGLEDVYEIARTGLKANLTGIGSEQFLVDARPSNQFNGTAPTRIAGVDGNSFYITTSWGFSGAPNAAADPAQKFILFEGGIKGAVDFPWLDMLTDGTTGWRYKTKSELRTIFANKGYVTGRTVISQCRTNFEAQVNGFAAQNILGYPTVFYDGSLVEWTSLTASHPASSFNKVSSTFRWATDNSNVSRILWYNGNAADTSRLQAVELDPTATTTKKFIAEDKAYKNLF